MRCKRFILMTLIVVLLSASRACPRDAQPLAYHAGRMTIKPNDLGSQVIHLPLQVPRDLELPNFRSSKAVFGKWTTPMAPGGYLWVAFDRSGWKKSYDRMYIDTNCDGSLKDEKPIAGRISSRYSCNFSPVDINFPGPTGPLPYRLTMDFYNYGDRPIAVARSACWYGGKVTVGGVKRDCVLIDYNANGTFNDKSLYPDKADRIKLHLDDKADAAFVGNFVMVDGKLYRPDIARDGTGIALSEAADATFGALQAPPGISEIAFGGENGKFVFRPTGSPERMPIGEYRLLSWAVEQKDEKGRQWKLQANNYGDKGVINLAQAGEPNLAVVGQPVISKLEVYGRGSDYRISHTLAGRFDERINITCDGKNPAAPKVRIRNEDGSYNQLFALEYG